MLILLFVFNVSISALAIDMFFLISPACASYFSSMRAVPVTKQKLNCKIKIG